jgi:biopolymer transport protein ExbD
MRQRKEEGGLNMTPMIDVVFQLIIFFIVTVAQQQKEVEMELRLAMAPDGKAVERKDPRTITVDVDTQGRVYIARQRLSLQMLQNILRGAVARHGQTLPVVIRADAGTRHEYVRRVMDVCSQAGLWKIKFAAIKERAK